MVISDNLKLVATSSVKAFWSRAYAVAFQYLITLIIARALGPKLMGSFFLGFAILSILSLFCQMGLGSGLLKFFSIGLMERDYSYSKKILLFSLKYVFGLSVTIAIIIYIFRDLLSLHVFADPHLKLVLFFIAVTLPFYSLFLFSVEASKAFKRIGSIVAIQNIFYPTVHILFLVGFLGIGWKLSSPLTSLLIAIILSLIAFFFIFKRLLPQPEGNMRRVLDAREIFSVSIPIFLSHIMAFLMYWTDTVMLGIFKTSQEVGFYTAATKTAAFVVFLLTAVNYILPPLAAQLYEKGEKRELESIARRTARWNLIFSITVTMAFALFGKEILLLFGHEFVIAYIPLLILSCGQVINAGTGSVGYILAMTGFHKILTYISIFIAVLNVVLNIFLITPFSIAGAALATGFSLALGNIINAYFVKRYVGIVPYPDNILKIIVYLVIGGAISFLGKTYLGLEVGISCFLIITAFSIIKILMDSSDKMIIKYIVLRAKEIF